MDVKIVNKKLSLGELDLPAMFPHLVRLKDSPYIFHTDFGLKDLPLEPGILMIRGPRQYGKSTWLEQQIVETIKKFGAGTAFYLNGETIFHPDVLENELNDLLTIFPANAPVRRIFIDEITAIEKWEIALKRMADQGKLTNILVVTTGSKATDLRRGAEKLPGRKGKLARTTYLFTPISYREFHKVCGKTLGEKTLMTYLLSGGSPIACSELAINGYIPEYVIELVRDWVDGEIAASGRSRIALNNILSVVFRFGGTPVGQAKLAREAGLANNTVASGYIEILNDLGCVVPAYPWDTNRKLQILRKQCKYHFANLLTAIAYHPATLRNIDDLMALPEAEQGIWYEWLVAQEILRRIAIAGQEILAPLSFWQDKNHEVDFVIAENNFIEVKRGGCSSLEFAWFARQFPDKQLTVVCASKFKTAHIQGQLLEDFLLSD